MKRHGSVTLITVVALGVLCVSQSWGQNEEVVQPHSSSMINYIASLQVPTLIWTGILGIITAIAATAAGFAATWIRKQRLKAASQIETIAAKFQDGRPAVLDNARIEALLKQELGRPQADLSKAVSTLTTLVHEITDKKPSPEVEALIHGYHEQALNQSSTQFWFSVIIATMGFAWILYFGLSFQSQDPVTALHITPGVILDAVAFLFFKQASETRQRATDLFDRLRKDKLSGDSIVLVASIEDARVRSAVKAQMALYMAGLTPTPINLSQFLSGDVFSPTSSFASDVNKSPTIKRTSSRQTTPRSSRQAASPPTDDLHAG